MSQGQQIQEPIVLISYIDKFKIFTSSSKPKSSICAIQSREAPSWQMITDVVDDLEQPANFSANRSEYREAHFIEQILQVFVFDIIVNFSKTVAFISINSESLRRSSLSHSIFPFKHIFEELKTLTFLRLGNPKLDRK